jgi:hypothetical protein
MGSGGPQCTRNLKSILHTMKANHLFVEQLPQWSDTTTGQQCSEIPAFELRGVASYTAHASPRCRAVDASRRGQYAMPILGGRTEDANEVERPLPKLSPITT